MRMRKAAATWRNTKTVARSAEQKRERKTLMSSLGDGCANTAAEDAVKRRQRKQPEVCEEETSSSAPYVGTPRELP